ncbi:hypothetical protein DZF91_25710, partial [Actinomadura logoneensis]
EPAADGTGEALVVEAPAEAVGRAAAASGVALVELRQAGGGGLEELFLTLTGRHTGPATQTSVPQEAVR